MQTKTLNIILLILVVLIGILLWGYGRSGTPGAPTSASVQGVTVAKESALTTEKALYDFGTISMKDGNVETEFTLSNLTDRDITITSVLTSCMCTLAYLLVPDGGLKGPFGMPGHGGPLTAIRETVRPGESRTLRVVYDPNAHGPAGVGAINRFIAVSDTSDGTLEFEIKAVVTP